MGNGVIRVGLRLFDEGSRQGFASGQSESGGKV